MKINESFLINRGHLNKLKLNHTFIKYLNIFHCGRIGNADIRKAALRVFFPAIAILMMLQTVSCKQIVEELVAKISQESKEIVGNNGLVRLTVPGSWSSMKDLNEEANLQVGSVLEEGYLVVISENREDFEDMTLQKFSEITSESIMEGLAKASQEEPEDILIGRHRAIKRVIEGVIDNLKISYVHVAVETEGNYHQIIGWSLKSKFEGNKSKFDKIIMSFKEVEAGN